MQDEGRRYRQAFVLASIPREGSADLEMATACERDRAADEQRPVLSAAIWEMSPCPIDAARTSLAIHRVP